MLSFRWVLGDMTDNSPGEIPALLDDLANADEEHVDVGPVQAARDNEPGEDDSNGPQQPDARRRQAAFARTRVLGLQQDEAEQEHAQR